MTVPGKIAPLQAAPGKRKTLCKRLHFAITYVKIIKLGLFLWVLTFTMLLGTFSVFYIVCMC